MIKRRKAISRTLALTMMLSTFTTVNANGLEPRADVSSSILAGEDRYETAVKVSESGWTSATNAVIINGDKGLVDALTATPYASLKNAPILVTEKDKLTKVTKDRLTKLGVKNVDIVGGEGVVSKAVENELKAMGLTVKRIKGEDRYETSVAVANEIKKLTTVNKITIVNGDKGLADAVSIAAPAADNKMPILLSDPKNGITEANKFISTVNVSKSYVVGQVTAVSNAIMNSLPGVKVRLGGEDRHETNTKVMKEFYTNESLDNIYVAKSGYIKNNEELVDALAVGVLAAKNDDPVLIVGKSLDNTQKSMLQSKKFTKITQVGGGIPAGTINAIKDTQKDPEAKVSGVSLVNYKTIKITGTELNRINASNITMSGNTVESYTANSAGTEATVVFSKVFNNGTNTVTVKSNLGNSTTHNFTYASAISSVEASTSEIGTSGIQYLKFTVNGGQERSAEEIAALGYTVKFESTQPIFYKDATIGQTTSVDGKLRTAPSFTKGETFNYKVTLQKGTEKPIVSSLKPVEVVDRVNEYKEIKSHEIKLENGNSSGVTITSNKLALGEKAEIVNLKAVNKNNNTVAVATTNATVQSSDTSVISVDKTGANKNKLLATGSGTAKITIKLGDVSKEFSMTVVAGQRVASSVSLSPSTINVSSSSSTASTIVKATVKDQHGDLLKGYQLQNDDKTTTVATLKATGTTSTAGTVDVVVETKDKVGTQKFDFKFHKDKPAVTLTVNVKAVSNTPNKWTLSVDDNKDKELDMYTKVGGTIDNTLDLNLNKYVTDNRVDYLLGKEVASNLTTGATTIENTFKIESSDASIAKISSISGEDIKITAVKAGKATIRAYKHGKKDAVASIEITVKDSTPKITNVTTYPVKDIVKATTTYSTVKNLINVTEVSPDKFKVQGITVSGEAEEILLGNDGSRAVLFVDRNDNNTYDSSTDLLLSTIDVGVNFSADVKNNGDVVGIDAEDKGEILVRMYHGAYDPSEEAFKKIIIKVDVPKVTR